MNIRRLLNKDIIYIFQIYNNILDINQKTEKFNFNLEKNIF